LATLALGVVVGVWLVTRSGGEADADLLAYPPFEMTYEYESWLGDSHRFETVILRYDSPTAWSATIADSSTPEDVGITSTFDGSSLTHEGLLGGALSSPAPDDGLVVPARWFIPRDYEKDPAYRSVPASGEGLLAYQKTETVPCPQPPVSKDSSDPVPPAIPFCADATGFESTEEITIDRETGIPLGLQTWANGELVSRVVASEFVLR
jgi:hypothetical protein